MKFVDDTPIKEICMKKNVFSKFMLVFVIITALIITPLGASKVVADTPEPIAEEESQDDVWICEEDPNRDVVLELRDKKFPASCIKMYEIENEYDKEKLVIPLRPIYKINPLDTVNTARRGDYSRFEVPAAGILFLNTPSFYEDSNTSFQFHYEDMMDIFVNGEEWFFSEISDVLYSGAGEFMIPKGSIIEIYVLQDLEFSLIDFFDFIQLERTYPNKCTHNVLSEDTVVDLGNNGAIRVTCDPETSRFSLSFNDPSTVVRNAILEMKIATLINHYGTGPVLAMPADGFVIVHDSRYVSVGNPDGFTEEKSHAEVIRFERNSLVTLYFKPSNLAADSVTIEFIN